VSPWSRVWLSPTPIDRKLKNDVVLGGLGICAIKWSRWGREGFFRQSYRHGLKSAFSEIISVQPRNLCGANIRHRGRRHDLRESYAGRGYHPKRESDSFANL
jgi:hypothetical protein